MIASTVRLAFRNLGRNPRRTALSVLGVGLGCAVALVISGLYESVAELYSRTAAETGPGHLRVAPEGWLPRRDDALRLADGAGALERLRALEGVRVAAPRVRVQALLAMGNQVAGAELAGVDPAAEPASYRFVRNVVAGRYLEPGDGDLVVLGRSLAERLRVEVDDDVVVTAVGHDGAMQSAMVRVVGVVTSGSRELDAQIAQVPLATAEHLWGAPGLAEIALILDDFGRIDALRPAVAQAAGQGNVVLRWSDVSADLATHLNQDVAMSRLLSGIVVFVVLLGVAAAQLTAVLERRREFAVFAAVGMRPWRLVLQLLTEALALGLAGAVAGALVAAPILARLMVKGLDLSSLMQGEMTFEGILMDPVLYAQLGWWMVPYVLGLALAATLLGAIYPAIYAARTDPATALRSAA